MFIPDPDPDLVVVVGGGLLLELIGLTVALRGSSAFATSIFTGLRRLKQIVSGLLERRPLLKDCMEMEIFL